MPTLISVKKITREMEKSSRTNAGIKTYLQVNHELNESLTVVNLLHGDGA